MKLIQNIKKNERGNALFLILIAVALFAALSYAVTQSGRGGGSIDKEQALIAASQITQYAAGLRTTATRMLITGTSAGALNFGDGDSDDVFDSTGGGAIEQDPPSGAGTSPAYTYLEADHATDGWYITGIGTDTVTTGREVMIAAATLTESVCSEINRGLGLSETGSSILVEATAVVLGTPFNGAGAADNAGTFNAYNANPQAFACVENGANVFTYYHAIVEQ